MTPDQMRVLFVTTQWPSALRPDVGVSVAPTVKHLRQSGVELDLITFAGNRDPRNYLAARRRVRERLATERYDVVHAYPGQSALVVPRGVRLVVTIDENDLSRLTGWLLRRVDRLVARRATAISATTARAAGLLMDRELVDVIQPGVDLETFRPLERNEARHELGLGSQGKLVLLAEPDVAKDAFVRAYDAVVRLRARVDADLVVMPLVPPVVRAAYLAASDVVLMITPRPGIALAVREAVASDRRVVVPECDETRTILELARGCSMHRGDIAEIAAGLEQAVTAADPFDGRSLAGESAAEVAAKWKSIYERAHSAVEVDQRFRRRRR